MIHIIEYSIVWWCSCCKKTEALAHEKSTVEKKICVAGWGLLIGGCVFLFVGGTALKGGSLSELPKTSFCNKILIRNRSFGKWFFFCLGLLKFNRWTKHIPGRLMRKHQAMQCWCSCCRKTKHLHMRKEWWEKTLLAWVGFTNWGVRLFICGGDRAQGG